MKKVLIEISQKKLDPKFRLDQGHWVWKLDRLDIGKEFVDLQGGKWMLNNIFYGNNVIGFCKQEWSLDFDETQIPIISNILWQELNCMKIFFIPSTERGSSGVQSPDFCSKIDGIAVDSPEEIAEILSKK